MDINYVVDYEVKVCVVAPPKVERDLFGFEKVPFVKRVKRRKAIAGEPHAFMEQSLLIETNDCICWPYARTKHGYAWMGTENACRVICERIYGPPPTSIHLAAHSCGKGHLGCINWKHLRWATTKENHDDKARHGTMGHRDNNGNAKLTEKDVFEIRKLKGMMKKGEIADKFGVSTTTIGKILNNKMWWWLGNPDLKYNGPQLF